MNWGWLHGYDNGDFEDGDNADNLMGGGPLGILLYQMRYSGRCSVFYIELLLEDIDWEVGQNSNHIVVGFPTSGWVSNQWVEIHPWCVNFQPFTLVGLGAVVQVKTKSSPVESQVETKSSFGEIQVETIKTKYNLWLPDMSKYSFQEYLQIPMYK